MPHTHPAIRMRMIISQPQLTYNQQRLYKWKQFAIIYPAYYNYFLLHGITVNFDITPAMQQDTNYHFFMVLASSICSNNLSRF